MNTKIDATIRSDTWEIQETRENLGLDCLGVCVADAKVIITDPKLRGKTRLEVLVHEFAHAFFPDLEEDVVDQFGGQLGDVMWSLGYRRSKHKSKAVEI